VTFAGRCRWFVERQMPVGTDAEDLDVDASRAADAVIKA
jgi:hypothetical protein